MLGRLSRSSRNRAASHRQAGASNATGYQTVNCSSNSIPHRIGCAFGQNPALTLYQTVAELISKNRVQIPKIASQLTTLRAGPPAPPPRESSLPGSIVFFSIKRLCSDPHDLTDSLFGKFHPDSSFNSIDLRRISHRSGESDST
jgi:hypothetical protein